MISKHHEDVELDGVFTMEQFIDRFYKPDRLEAEPGRRERIIADRNRDIMSQGVAIISRHDSVTGRTLTLCMSGRVAESRPIQQPEHASAHTD